MTNRWIGLNDEHHHVNWGIDVLPVDKEIVIVKNEGLWQIVFLTIHDIGQGAVVGVVFAGLYLNRQHFATLFDNEVQLSPLLTVVLVGFQPVCDEFLCHCILIDGAKVDVLVSLDNPHLNAVGILGRQQTDIAEE